MNPYEGIVQALLFVQFLMALLICGMTGTMMRRLRRNPLFAPPSELSRLYREQFPNSPLPRMRVVSLTLSGAIFAVTLVFLHMNMVQNRIYFENAQKQTLHNAQRIAEMKKVR
jgi:hypothetical protein